MEKSLNKKIKIDSFNRVTILALTIILALQVLTSLAEDKISSVTEAFNGVPKVTINITELDNTGQLIYCGVDIAVFWDPDKDGKFTVVPDDSKVKRLITTNTNITFDLGPISTYKKGVQHKLAMRTLYVPTGTKQEPIVIADFDNGNEGWVEIPGTLFIPTYFINPIDNPYIKHTEKWNDNRNEYNLTKSNIGQEESIRSEGVFWSGEKFVLNIETAEIVSGVAVTILDDNKDTYKTILTTYEENKNVSGAAIYKGELWDKSMFNKWGNYIPKTLKFKLEILDSKEQVLEEKFIEAVVDNRDFYYRSRRQF